MILLDTNVLSEAFKPRPDAGVLEAVRDVGDDGYVSTVVMGELRFGAQLLPFGRRRTEIMDYYNSLRVFYEDRILPVSLEVAEIWAQLRAQYRQSGRSLPLADGLIAATALHHDLKLMTRNIRDFEPTGVRLINPWEDGTWISH